MMVRLEVKTWRKWGNTHEIPGQYVPARESCPWQDPESGWCLSCWSESENASVAGAEQATGRKLVKLLEN